MTETETETFETIRYTADDPAAPATAAVLPNPDEDGVPATWAT
jgi:hypothetical protein